jgi:hypothetical protein
MPSASGSKCSQVRHCQTVSPAGAGHLGQVIGVHLPCIGIPARCVLAGLHDVLFDHAALDAAGNLLEHLTHAIQQNVAVGQQDTMVVMVRMTDLP